MRTVGWLLHAPGPGKAAKNKAMTDIPDAMKARAAALFRDPVDQDHHGLMIALQIAHTKLQSQALRNHPCG